MEEKKDREFRGRGAQINAHNPFLKQRYVQEHLEVIDEELFSNSKTEYLEETAKKIVNKVDSPDLGMMYSMNPYQGCEHGCIYCYARNTHQYWNLSAGLDFERKIIIKKNAAELLEKQLSGRNWEPSPIMLSGNTDCYQPIERKLKITRSMLEILLKFRHPVSMITKNSLILRDLDILTEMAKLKLVHVMVSITSLDESLRQNMEPRTATALQRMKVIKELNAEGVPCGIMTAPVIPGLNSMEIPALIEMAAENGARCAGYTMVRLNGAIGEIFTDWIRKTYPEKAEKVLNHIRDAHKGQLNDSRFGTRMRGEGKMVESIEQLFGSSVARFLKGRGTFEFDMTLFRVPPRGQLNMFD